MKFRIITWNARGGVIEDQHKHQNIVDMIKQSISDGMGLPVLMIQEAGTYDIMLKNCHKNELKFNRYVYRYYSIVPYDNGNPNQNYRCTLAILCPSEWDGFAVTYPIQSQQKNRPLAAFLLRERFLIATIHATAGSPVAITDVCAALSTIGKQTYPCMLLGDMNSEPACYTEQLGAKGFSVVHPGEATHISGKLYDYMFVGNSNSVEVVCRGTGNSACSDHYPVIYDVDVNSI